MPRSTSALKTAVFEALTGDSTLQTLLGGAGKIVHGNPLQLSQYPCVTYEIITETDEPYNPDFATAITRTRLSVASFSSQTASSQVDAIDDRVYALLHGANLSTADLTVFSCYRVNRTPLWEPEQKVWHVESRFDVVNVGI